MCKCDFCGSIIPDVDIQYEDYYQYNRGCTLGAEAGYICFDCLQANRKKYDYEKRNKSL